MRQKLEVNEVWILQEVIPYEGSSIISVFADVATAKASRPSVKRWYEDSTGGFLSKQPTTRSYEEFFVFFVITKHMIRTK